jgi:hypothetical protein
MGPPFSWICRQEALPWFGDQIDGNVILLHAHGHNRLAHDETSHPPTNTLSVYFSCGFAFLTEKLFTAFSGIPGETSQKFHLCLLTLASYFYPLGLYPLLPTR